MLRSHTCGELRAKNIGEDVVLSGWVETIRKHANVTFVVLRDRYGHVQVTVESDIPGLDTLGKESVVTIHGKVKPRPEGAVVAHQPTGEIEVEAQRIDLLGACEPLPFEIRDDAKISDDLRLEYRYLDMRRPVMLKRLTARHKTVQVVRRCLDDEGFLEVEPPMFVKSTPEGSRDFIVPSRLYPGRVYALPQSPQLYKQLLMIAGIDRYYSFPRCFRDEDPRRGRQLVHTQIDLEMSLVTEDDVFGVVERFLKAAFAEIVGGELSTPFPRFTWEEVMRRWGIDKPDLRFGMELVDLGEPASAITGFEVFQRALREGGQVKGIVAPGCAGYSRGQLDELEAFAKRYRVGGLAWIKMEAGGLRASFSKLAQANQIQALAERAGAVTGDLVLIVADPRRDVVARTLGELRNMLGRRLLLIPQNVYRPLWVTEFPMFEWNEEEKHWSPMHHMFTQPKADHIPFLTTRPADVRAHLYDVVLNGVELASGSIRITNPTLQKQIMDFVGYPAERAEENFGFLLRAYRYGAPPHAGIALGLDNLVMTMLGLTNIQDVIAFPNNSAGVFPLDGSPSRADEAQLLECHLAVTHEKS